jgi:hypothetical protein
VSYGPGQAGEAVTDWNPKCQSMLTCGMDQARQIDGFQQHREPQVVVDYLAELAVHVLAERTVTAAINTYPSHC